MFSDSARVLEGNDGSRVRIPEKACMHVILLLVGSVVVKVFLAVWFKTSFTYVCHKLSLADERS